MKTADQLKPNYAPIYAAALYPGLAQILHWHGYALAVHGSLARDFDLIAIPWRAEDVSDPEVVVKEITEKFDIRKIGEAPEPKPHRRIAYTISVGHGECALDLSFMPRGEERWFSGPIMCVKCSHRWVAVAPVTGDETPKALQCPACHEMTGYPTKEQA